MAQSVDPSDIPEALHDEALAWVTRLMSGDADADAQAAFLLWRDQSPRHRRALAEARDLWTSIGPALVAGQERRAGEAFATPVPMDGRPALGRRGRARPFPGRYAALAASVAASLLVGLAVFRPSLADYHTGGGERSTKVLADGSRVTLGPDSAIDVAFDDDGTRRVVLARGEAMFDVVHDPARPFLVRSGKGEARVLGTAFAVRKAGGMTRVTVQRGRVEVRSGTQMRVLEADRSVDYGLTTMGGVRAVDTTTALGWTRGWLFFENRALADVIAELDRYAPEKVVLLNRAAGRRRINGAIDLSRDERWIEALGRSEALTVTRLPGVVLIR